MLLHREYIKIKENFVWLLQILLQRLSETNLGLTGADDPPAPPAQTG